MGLNPEVPLVTAEWLALREPADAAARAADLVDPLRRRLPDSGPIVIHDLGSGTGAMLRWLAPRLPGPQHWIMHDRDAGLLERVTPAHRPASGPAVPVTAADGAPVTVETRRGDITRLTAADLAFGDLVTASALLDMLTAYEIGQVIGACTGAGCPVLMTVSVVGRVVLMPPDPLDPVVAAAFNDHQRRTLRGRDLLGPDAVAVATAEFHRRGVGVLARPSPWRLGPGHAALTGAWFDGWLAAACLQRPELARPAVAYGRRRRAELAAGQLRVVVGHDDLLAGCS